MIKKPNRKIKKNIIQKKNQIENEKHDKWNKWTSGSLKIQAWKKMMANSDWNNRLSDES